MKLAAIDIGTNSTRLLISGCKKKPSSTYKLTTLAREMEITRIGKNLDGYDIFVWMEREKLEGNCRKKRK